MVHSSRDRGNGGGGGEGGGRGLWCGRCVGVVRVGVGMGGEEKGEFAAEISVGEITRRFQHEARNRLRKPADFLVSAIQSAHRAIVSHAVEHNLLECPRTTCVACIIQGGSAWWAHAGDSRLYVLRGGAAAAATPDPSEVPQTIHAGEITPEAG